MADYPICKDCKNYERKTVVTQDRKVAHIDVCNRWPHPITGNALPCQEARQDSRFCGFEGRAFEERVEEEPKVVAVPLIVTGDNVN